MDLEMRETFNTTSAAATREYKLFRTVAATYFSGVSQVLIQIQY